MKLIVPKWHMVNSTIADWAGEKLNVTFSAPYIALGVARSEEAPWKAPLEGAIILNGYTDANIDMSVVGERCWTPSIMRQVSEYVFNQLFCERVTMITRASNKTARKILGKHFVFETGRKRHFGTEDGLQFRMCRDECPWLENK